jgi:hypothetical protein
MARKLAAAPGIVGTKIPQDNSDVAFVHDEGGQFSISATMWYDFFPENPHWTRVGGGDPRLWPFGAVEVYSGASIVDSYCTLRDISNSRITGSRFFTTAPAANRESQEAALRASWITGCYTNH